MIEHLKETNTSWHDSHSFGMNFGAMVNFGMNPCASNCLLSVPGARNHKKSSRKETLVESGIYAQEIYINIGKTIEMTPTLRNEEKTSVFDTVPTSSIGSIIAGVQEINTLLNGIKRDAAQRHIHDAKVEQVIEDVKQITDKSDEKTVEMQDKLDAIENKTKHAINENIAENSENLSEKEVEDLSKKNIEILESIVYESAREKVAVVEARIAELEREKASVNAASRCVEASQELGDAFYDSAIDGLKSVLEALNYTIENPGEVLQSACEISLHLGKKAADFAQYCVENPDLIYDKVILKSKELYEYTRDNLGECALNIAEYVPGIGGILEGSRDFYQIYEAKTEPRTVADKWRNYGLFAAVLGKGGRKTAESIVEVLQEAEVKAAEKAIAIERGIGKHKYVGGHHPIQSAAFKGYTCYNAREAIAISENKLRELFGVEHLAITTEQRILQKELEISGMPNTMAEQVRIAWLAMVRAGIPEKDARSLTAEAFWKLREMNVKHPTRIPWSKK